MSLAKPAEKTVPANRWGWCFLFIAFLITGGVYAPGLSGNYLFDDYPNLVDNKAVQPPSASIANLVGAALSSTSSEFKRPLASLSFAANYLVSGLNPYWMKLTNLAIHLMNGLLIFLLARLLISSTEPFGRARSNAGEAPNTLPTAGDAARTGIIAALISASWMLLPINLTAVLYVVQRMESMANLFVLSGLIGYVVSRQRMLAAACQAPAQLKGSRWKTVFDRNYIFCIVSITVPAVLGILAKETAVMLPLYAALIEWAIFRCRLATTEKALLGRLDVRIIGMFMLILFLPLVAGLAWLLPGLLDSSSWATRDFTLRTRLLSEARVVVDYVMWTLLPTPHSLSFYHDNFVISAGLLKPWTTLASVIFLALLVTLAIWLRKSRPLAALGLGLFLGCQLLTATVIPLELIYEHRNYFASFGLLLAIIPRLTASAESSEIDTSIANPNGHRAGLLKRGMAGWKNQSLALPRYVLTGGLLICWTSLTAITAYTWGNPLRLAEDLSIRAPDSPRAQYELGRTYIIYSHYDASSPFTPLVYAPLEKAAALPDSSILAEQALIFFNARMHRPLKDVWWKSMIAKLTARKSTVQDESSLSALTRCANDYSCDLPVPHMMAAFGAALSHPNPSPRLLATYSDYVWHQLNDHDLGERMIADAVRAAPNEPAYQITLIRMLVAIGRTSEARVALNQLTTLNIGGRLNPSLEELRKLPGLR